MCLKKKRKLVPSYFSVIFRTVYCSVARLPPSLGKYVDNNMVFERAATCFAIHTWLSPADTAALRRRSWACCGGSEQTCVSFKSRSMLGGSRMRTVWASERQEMLRHHQAAATLTTLIHIFWTLQIFTLMCKWLESSDMTGTFLLAVCLLYSDKANWFWGSSALYCAHILVAISVLCGSAASYWKPSGWERGELNGEEKTKATGPKHWAKRRRNSP